MFEEVKQPQFLTGEVKLLPERYYCLFCVDTSPHSTPSGWTTGAAVAQHVDSSHDVVKDDCYEGEHFCTGADFAEILARWKRGNEDGAARFERYLESLTTVDDFLLECGDV